MKEQVAVSWSGGKDCTLALFEILQSGQYQVHGLHTTFNTDTKRVGLHGVKQSLIEQQAKSIGHNLDAIFIVSAENHDVYEEAMSGYYHKLAEQGIRKVVFGDIFLEDLKRYRENMLTPHELEGIFPLWKTDSRSVAEKFIRSGFKALVCAADAKYFRDEDAGREYDFDFINSLDPAVDPCGENGEFHTFVYDGPIFKEPIQVLQKQVEGKEYHFKINLPNGQSESRSSKFWFRELECINPVGMKYF